MNNESIQVGSLIYHPLYKKIAWVIAKSNFLTWVVTEQKYHEETWIIEWADGKQDSVHESWVREYILDI